MSTERKVAVITGASQGIGEGLVRGYLERGYRIVANSRSIEPSSSPDVIAIPGVVVQRVFPDLFLADQVDYRVPLSGRST
jgi:NAD(P)-dependent dehydrogenase (short-subunit alcohol dehydrogenase family)